MTSYDNIADLRAQVAANQKVLLVFFDIILFLHGFSTACIILVSELIDAYGLNVIQAHMKYNTGIYMHACIYISCLASYSLCYNKL